MAHRVLLQRLAVQDLQDAFAWARRHAPVAAARWLARFQSALQTLDTNPQRYGLAREALKAGLELREFTFGKRPAAFRAIYLVQDDTVRVLRIRRAQRRALTAKQIEESLGD
jgi:plasmid stabilization system protein ParE